MDFERSRATWKLAEVEEDHRKLSELLQQLQQASAQGDQPDVVGRVLADLFDYTHFHFAREEDLMAAYGYPFIDDHKAEHEVLFRRVLQFLEDVPSPLQPSLESELLEFLRTWIDSHIDGPDKEFAEWLVQSAGLPNPA